MPTRAPGILGTRPEMKENTSAQTYRVVWVDLILEVKLRKKLSPSEKSHDILSEVTEQRDLASLLFQKFFSET